MKRKGLMSFIALMMIMIASLFVFYFINMNETHSLSLFVKHNLDRATKAAALSVNETLIENGIFKIDETVSVENFSDVFSLNLGLDNPLTFSEIKESKGVNYVFSYKGGEVFESLARLNETPKVTYFVFNASNERVSDAPTDVANFISEIRTSIGDVQISDDSADDRAIKDAILKELTGKNYNGIATGRMPQIVDTRSFILAIAEIPLNAFGGSLENTYRFSTARLNSSVEVNESFTKKVENGLTGRYYDIPEGFIPSSKGSLIGTRVDKQIDFSWGEYESYPGADADGVWITWSGLIKANETGVTEFKILSDEGVTISIDGAKIIDEWNNQGLGSFTGSLSLIKDKWYPVEINYYDSVGSSEVRFSWKYGSMIEHKVVPYVNLLPYTVDYDGSGEFYSKTFSAKEPSGLDRKGEVLEVPLVFDTDKMVKESYNMNLLSGTNEIRFTLDDVVKNTAGYITYAKLVFVDDFSPGEEKEYTLVFSDGLVNYLQKAPINIVSSTNYVEIKSDEYDLYFKKNSASGYSKAYIDGGSTDVLGEKSDKNFFFSSINGSGYTDWGALSKFEIISENPVYKEIHYTVNDVDGLLQYVLKAKYYHGSETIKHTVEVKNISDKSLYSFKGGYAPKINSNLGGKSTWGVAYDGSLVTTGYTPEFGKYLATGASSNGVIGIHSYDGVSDKDYEGIMLSYDGESQVLNPGETSLKKSFLLTLGNNPENFTMRLASPMLILAEDTFRVLDKPNAPTIVPSNTGTVNPLTPITFSIQNTVDQNGKEIVKTQWEGISSNNLYTGGANTVKARVQNELGIWSDWTEYTFIVKINLLEVYPFGPQLGSMIISLGQTGINVDAISVDNFNTNRPDLTNYDVVVFGFGDRYAAKDISDFMADKVQSFIAGGGGVIFTHDTMETSSKRFYTYFKDYLKLTPGGSSWTSASVKRYGSNKLLDYPYELPSTISIRTSSWQPFNTSAEVSVFTATNPSVTWHTISNRNVAYVNSGGSVYNSSGTLVNSLSSAPLTERQLIVNTIFAVSGHKNTISAPVAKIQSDKSSYLRGETMKLTPFIERMPNGKIVEYSWKIEELFGSRRTFTYSSETVDFNIPVTPNEEPLYKVSLQVTDILGVKSMTESREIRTFNQAPSITSFTYTSVKDGIVYLVTFATTESDPEGDSISLEWENKEPFYLAGKHTVRVRAVDSLGLASTWKTVELNLE